MSNIRNALRLMGHGETMHDADWFQMVAIRWLIENNGFVTISRGQITRGVVWVASVPCPGASAIMAFDADTLVEALAKTVIEVHERKSQNRETKELRRQEFDEAAEAMTPEDVAAYPIL